MKTTRLMIIFLLFFSAMSFVSATDEPKLVSVTDSLGNIQTNSWAKGTGGDWKSELRTDSTHVHCSNCIIKIGDKIRIGEFGVGVEQNVDSMQFEHKAIAEAKAGEEVGLKVTTAVKEGDIVYKISE